MLNYINELALIESMSFLTKEEMKIVYQNKLNSLKLIKPKFSPYVCTEESLSFVKQIEKEIKLLENKIRKLL